MKGEQNRKKKIKINIINEFKDIEQVQLAAYMNNLLEVTTRWATDFSAQACCAETEWNADSPRCRLE